MFGGRGWCCCAGFLGGLTVSPAGGAAGARCEVETRGGTFTLSAGASWSWSCGWFSDLPGGTAGFSFFFTLPLSGGGFVESPVVIC